MAEQDTNTRKEKMLEVFLEKKNADEVICNCARKMLDMLVERQLLHGKAPHITVSAIVYACMIKHGKYVPGITPFIEEFGFTPN